MQCIGQECCPEGNTHNAIWNEDLGQCVYVQGGADIVATDSS